MTSKRQVLAPSMSVPIALNQELIGDQQPFFGHFYPGGLSMILTKVSVLALSGRLRTVQKRIEEMEEEDEEAIMNIELSDVLAPSRHKHELSMWKGFGRNLRLGMIRDLAILSVQRVYEVLSINFIKEESTARAIVKNVPRSAVRKAERYSFSSSLTYINEVSKTAFKGQIMFWLALFTVNQAVDTYFTFYVPGGGNEPVGLPPPRETYRHRLILNAARCAGGCVLAAIGAAIGSQIRPGIGTTLGMNIAPQFVFLLV
eukprot:CAMPEP_0184530992 /NCGR_PEP_ID=MMETSP0198_2-20121128/13280_1 /TAXON_ID=1112570 /ORGANISM="Thraustochytrium sp., Strain LLF1b" /LENGTH=257 /DNA_ID=CAMNT_0026923261 /DNA_START=1803 /DNA_END=2576 /DNA_ORIENTATION=-